MMFEYDRDNLIRLYSKVYYKSNCGIKRLKYKRFLIY